MNIMNWYLLSMICFKVLKSKLYLWLIQGDNFNKKYFYKQFFKKKVKNMLDLII